MVFVIFHKNGFIRVDRNYDDMIGKMLQNHCVLLCFCMVELKSGRDLRQHRYNIIVTTLAPQFYFHVFRHNVKKVFERVPLRKHGFFELF